MGFTEKNIRNIIESSNLVNEFISITNDYCDYLTITIELNVENYIAHLLTNDSEMLSFQTEIEKVKPIGFHIRYVFFIKEEVF